MSNKALLPELGSLSATNKPDLEQRQIAISENRIDARELFQGTREIFIAHGDELYRLRLTSQNKLILTK